jgi:hypothetical protein
MPPPVIYPPVYTNGYVTPGGGYAYPMSPEGYAQRLRNQSGLGTYGGYGGNSGPVYYVPPASYGYGTGYGGYGGGYGTTVYQRRPHDTYAHDLAKKMRAEHPEIDAQAINAIGNSIGHWRHRGVDINSDPKLLDNLHESIVRRFGKEDGEKALKTMGIDTEHKTTPAAGRGEEHRPDAGARVAAKTTPKSSAAPAAPEKRTPAAGASMVGSIVGLLAGGFLGYKMMGMFGGGGLSVINLIVVAMIAVTAAKFGSSGGAMLANFLTPKPESPEKSKTPERSVATAVAKDKNIEAAEQAEKLKSAMQQYRKPGQAQEHYAGGGEVTLPTQAPYTPAPSPESKGPLTVG